MNSPPLPPPARRFRLRGPAGSICFRACIAPLRFLDAFNDRATTTDPVLKLDGRQQAP